MSPEVGERGLKNRLGASGELLDIKRLLFLLGLRPVSSGSKPGRTTVPAFPPVWPAARVLRLVQVHTFV